MSPGLAAAITGLAWTSGLGFPRLAFALLLAFGGDEPNGQLLGLAVLGMTVGGLVAFQASTRIRALVDGTRAEVLARLRHARSPDEARHAVRAAAVFAGDPTYSEQADSLSDEAVLTLCAEIVEKNDAVARFGPHAQHRPPGR